MRVKALIGFGGAFSMYKGEVKECNNNVILQDLLKSGYVEEVKEIKEVQNLEEKIQGGEEESEKVEEDQEVVEEIKEVEEVKEPEKLKRGRTKKGENEA